MVACNYTDTANDSDKKEEDLKFSCSSVNSTSESLSGSAPPRSRSRSRSRSRARTWGNDSVASESGFARRDWQSRMRWKTLWTWVLHDACLAVWHAMKWTGKRIARAPIWKPARWSKKQFFAFVLVVTWVVVPMTLIGYLTPLTSIFADKTLSCGNGFYGQPQNATVTGIEKLFALDATFGRFSFSQVKTIDILWDLLVGRGVQALAWWASYNVFCHALLRAIERHAASFEVFQRIAMEGPGLHSIWTLTKELWTAKSARTRALFFYMFWSTGYVLLVPIVLGAMTGYDSTAIAWIDLDGENNIIPASQMQETWVIKGTKNETFKQPACVDPRLQTDYNYITTGRKQNCDCQFPNGTLITAKQRYKGYYTTYYYNMARDINNCSYTYPNNTQTWTDTNYYDIISSASKSKDNIYHCNSTMSITVNGKTHEAGDLDTEYGYCYNNVGYDSLYLGDKSRCLPDTADPSYQWGFATLMTGLFILVTAIWSMTMYVLWQDAQFNCRLVAEGYRLTPLRAAFAMAVAARRRTGLGGRELVRVETRRLERELLGRKGSRGTAIEHHLFVENPEEGGETGLLPQPPLSPPSPAFASPPKEEEKCWPVARSPVQDHEVTSLVRSDTDISFHVLGDEELRKRYLRGAEEAGLSRKPLSREATWGDDGIWERGRGDDGEDDVGDDDGEDDDMEETKNGDADDEQGKEKGKGVGGKGLNKTSGSG